jgi:hypothetical protein
MKPFDLEAAKRGEPIVTRDGRKVIHFHHIETDTSRLCCVVQVEGQAGAGWVPKNGRYDDAVDGVDDLFMAPKMVTKYLNVYDSRAHGSYDGQSSFLFDNEEAAKDNADRNAVKVIVRAMPIQWEEA